MAHSYGMNIPDDLYERAEASRDKREAFCQWVFEAMELRLEAEEAAIAAGVDADELDDGWWREHLNEHRTRNEHEHSVEAD